MTRPSKPALPLPVAAAALEAMTQSLQEDQTTVTIAWFLSGPLAQRGERRFCRG